MTVLLKRGGERTKQTDDKSENGKSTTKQNSEVPLMVNVKNIKRATQTPRGPRNASNTK